jgi:hypothetical protein
MNNRLFFFIFISYNIISLFFYLFITFIYRNIYIFYTLYIDDINTFFVNIGNKVSHQFVVIIVNIQDFLLKFYIKSDNTSSANDFFIFSNIWNDINEEFIACLAQEISLRFFILCIS